MKLHRSITFWSGLLVISFTCWAWWDSSLRMTSVTFRESSFINGARGIAYDWNQGSASLPLGMDRGPFVGGDDDVKPFPPPLFERGAGRDLVAEFTEYVDRQPENWSPNTNEALRGMGARRSSIDLGFGSMRYNKVGDWRLFIPHWLILLTVAALWLALLLWRARRRKRTITP